MGGKSSKDIQGEGLVPRDGTDEVDVHPKKMVTQEQFDELLHKFSLLEQLMQQDKSKISDLESSVTQYHQDKQQLRQSFVEIDSEVKRDKEDREKLENNLVQRVEQHTRDKYLLLDEMLTIQKQRIEQLIKDQEANSNNIRAEYGQLDRKLTSSLQVDRDEVEKLVTNKLTEGKGDKGAFEKRISQMIDENSLSVSIVREQLEDRKKETQEVRESVEREKQALLEEISRVQRIMQDSKQTAESEKSISEQLSTAKEQLEERLSEEGRARLQLESLMKTMLDNKVGENQKQFLEQIKTQENAIQTQVQRMEQLRGIMDNSLKGEQARVREEVDKRISDMSVSYNEQLVIKETEKKDITRKLSQDFETRLQEMQSSLTKDIQVHRSKAESILEDSDQEKKNMEGKMDAMEGNLLQKIEDAGRESQLTVDDKLTTLRQELGSCISRNQQSESEVAALMEQLTQVRGDLSLVRDSQTEIKDDVELMQNKLPNDMDVKMQLIIQARVAEVSSELNEKYNRSEESFAQLADKLDALGTSSEPNQDPLHLEYVQKTSEDTAILLDRMDETGSQLQSVSEHVVELEKRLELSQTEVQQNQGQLQTAQADLLMLRSENSELTQKCETQAAELVHVLTDNSKLKQSIESVMLLLEEQTKDIELLKSHTGVSSSLSEIPPQSPLEKIEDMESVIKKQGHGINDLEFLIDQAKEMSKTSAENVENAMIKFDTKLEDETAKLRTELESLRTELTNKVSEISAVKAEQS